ncbi:hypothetical protein GH5_05550 [Leishmania sp. Ghana 2012 LV757]|uniref:hypothetical protein n=1 Tax=Leishmania sp. Ghana 2012 LV757 TaxID=2803181 RepID=UPI001B6CC288|nr:hypothetical protein GH5_05550 [Leishmania sp. Ghana 2012 LV757]
MDGQARGAAPHGDSNTTYAQEPSRGNPQQSRRSPFSSHGSSSGDSIGDSDEFSRQDIASILPRGGHFSLAARRAPASALEQSYPLRCEPASTVSGAGAAAEATEARATGAAPPSIAGVTHETPSFSGGTGARDGRSPDTARSRTVPPAARIFESDGNDPYAVHATSTPQSVVSGSVSSGRNPISDATRGGAKRSRDPSASSAQATVAPTPLSSTPSRGEGLTAAATPAAWIAEHAVPYDSEDCNRRQPEPTFSPHKSPDAPRVHSTASITFISTHNTAAEDGADADGLAQTSLMPKRFGDTIQQQLQLLSEQLSHPPPLVPEASTATEQPPSAHSPTDPLPLTEPPHLVSKAGACALAETVPPAAAAPARTPIGVVHVRIPSALDVVEAASHASASTSSASGRSCSCGRGECSGGSCCEVRVEPARSRQRCGAARQEHDVDAQVGPVFLTPDELQSKRTKAYDCVTDSGGGSGHRHGSDAATTGVDGSIGAHSTAHDSVVSTLDFLEDTATTILPEALSSMFASTTNFLRAKADAVVKAVPQPLRRAASRAGEGIATAAGVTGSVISSMQAYAMRTVPDRVLSPEWKYLIFVDAVNVFKCSCSVNILVAPYILRMGGILGGVLLMIVMQLVCCYYTEVFFEAKHQLRRAEHVIMYGDVPRMTFGRWYPTFQLWYDGVALVATVAYAALNMQALLPHMSIKGGAAKALSFIVPSLLCLPLAFMKRASTQPPMLALASLLIFVSLVMMFTVFPYGRVANAAIRIISHEDSSVAVLPLFPNTVSEFFVALSISVYIFTPLRTAVPVERTMDPRRYIKLLRVCAAISTVVYIAFAVCVIVSYGSRTCSVLSTSFDGHHTSVEVGVMSLLFFAFLLLIPLALFELVELADRRILGWRTIPNYGQSGPNCLRVLFLVVSAVLACEVPYYGLLTALCGSLGYAVVAVIVPAALDYVCRERHCLLRGHKLRFLDYVVVFSGALFGISILVMGTTLTLYQMWLVPQAGYAYAC